MRIVLANEVEEQLWAYTHAVNTEIAAWGYVKPDEHGDLNVYKVFLVPQEVSGAEVDFVTEGMPFAVETAIEEGEIENLRFCWHSHVNMGTGFSNVDEDMISTVKAATVAPWFVSVIFNKKGDTNGRIDLFKNGIHESLNNGLSHISGIKLDVIGERALTLHDEIEKDVKQYVKRKVVKPVTTKNTSKSWTKPKQKSEDKQRPRELESGPSKDDADEYFMAQSLDEMSEGQLRFEIAQYEKVETMNSTWEDVTSEPFAYWFNHEGGFETQCLTKEAYEEASDLINYIDGKGEDK